MNGNSTPTEELYTVHALEKTFRGSITNKCVLYWDVLAGVLIVIAYMCLFPSDMSCPHCN